MILAPAARFVPLRVCPTMNVDATGSTNVRVFGVSVEVVPVSPVFASRETVESWSVPASITVPPE